jgi:hypothetical protein
VIAALFFADPIRADDGNENITLIERIADVGAEV